MGISLFPKKKTKPADPESSAPAAPLAANPPAGGPEKLTANEWAKKLNLNEVAAERAAMRAGKWHATFTEEEFLDLIRASRV